MQTLLEMISSAAAGPAETTHTLERPAAEGRVAGRLRDRAAIAAPAVGYPLPILNRLLLTATKIQALGDITLVLAQA